MSAIHNTAAAKGLGHCLSRSCKRRQKKKALVCLFTLNEVRFSRLRVSTVSTVTVNFGVSGWLSLSFVAEINREITSGKLRDKFQGQPNKKSMYRNCKG